MSWLSRMREPSTWAGIAALVAVWRPEVGAAVPGLGEALTGLAATVFGVVAAVRKDPGSRD